MSQIRSICIFRVLRLLSSPSCDSEGVTPEECYEMASPYIARDVLSDAPHRTAIRWVLARLNAMHHGLPVNASSVIQGYSTPDVGTPVSVLEIGFKRKCAPGRKSKPSPLTADPDLPLRFCEQKKRRHIFSPLDVQYVRVLI